LRSYLRGLFDIQETDADRAAAAPWELGRHFTTGDVAARLSMAAPEVKGSADLNVSVQVQPSEDFVSRIVSAPRNGINAFTGTGTAGSTDVSMPEAGPAP
jgi:hypothetical protein